MARITNTINFVFTALTVHCFQHPMLIIFLIILFAGRWYRGGSLVSWRGRFLIRRMGWWFLVFIQYSPVFLLKATYVYIFLSPLFFSKDIVRETPHTFETAQLNIKSSDEHLDHRTFAILQSFRNLDIIPCTTSLSDPPPWGRNDFLLVLRMVLEDRQGRGGGQGHHHQRKFTMFNSCLSVVDGLD